MVNGVAAYEEEKKKRLSICHLSDPHSISLSEEERRKAKKEKKKKRKENYYVTMWKSMAAAYSLFIFYCLRRKYGSRNARKAVIGKKEENEK